MDSLILKLASEMLRIASEHYSNHGCNDLDNEILNLITENEEKLCRDMTIWNGDIESNWPEDKSMITDAALMKYLSDKLNPLDDKNGLWVIKCTHGIHKGEYVYREDNGDYTNNIQDAQIYEGKSAAEKEYDFNGSNAEAAIEVNIIDGIITEV